MGWWGRNWTELNGIEGRGSFCFDVFSLFMGLFSKGEPLCLWAEEKGGGAGEDWKVQEKGGEWT